MQKGTKKELKEKMQIYLGIQLDGFPIKTFSIGYSRKIKPKIGLYSFLSKGKYIAPDSFSSVDLGSSYVDYIGLSAGGMFYF